ncbi:hypothetical protein ACXDF8_24425 [Mycolicibacterium sp. CBM1]
MVSRSVLAARTFAIGNLATVFLYAGITLGLLLVALYLQELAGLSPAQAGLAAVEPTQSGIGSAINNAVARVSGLIAIALTANGFRRGVAVTAVLLVMAGAVAAAGIGDDGGWLPDGSLDLG